MQPVALPAWRLGKEPDERDDQIFRVAESTSVEASRRREDDPSMMLAGCRPGARDPIEVLHVLGDESALLGHSEAKEILVGHHRQRCIVGGRGHVVTLRAKAFGCSTGVMHVEKQL